jgi:hypothetical protein
MSTPHTCKQFLKALCPSVQGDVAATRALRRALLKHASETPDNLACAKHIGVSTVKARYFKGKTKGITLRRRWLVSDILWQSEGSRIPMAVQERYRGITQQEWEAVQRLATLVFIALEKDTPA